MKITITGMPGSGKTSVGQKLAEKLGLEFLSIGDMRGKMAMDRGITIEELNKMPWADKEVDDFQKEYGAAHDNFIVEGRLAFYFIPDSVKIFLDVNLRAAAKRVFNDPRPDEKKRATVEDEMKAMSDRIRGDKKRYLKIYGVDPNDKKQFDIVVDTTNITREETLKILEEKMKKLSS